MEALDNFSEQMLTEKAYRYLATAVCLYNNNNISNNINNNNNDDDDDDFYH